MRRTMSSNGPFETAWITVSPARNAFVMPKGFITLNVRVWNNTGKNNAAVLKNNRDNRVRACAIRDADQIVLKVLL